MCKMHDFMHDLAESVAGRESSLLNSNSSTSELDENCRHLSVDFSFIPLQKGKKLRTLLVANKKVDNMSYANWEWIVSDCRCLRVLELCDLNIFGVPRSIKKLKHLRYLDLSWNPNLHLIPNNICKIQNLQVLKVECCYQLKELPKKIEKLVNLTHLSCAGCWGLTHMPRGIRKLTSLEMLSMFVVDKDGAHGAAAADLSELGGLNSLRGELIIKHLGFVKNPEEKFKAANLEGKKHLQSLVLEWRGDINDAGNEDDDDEKKSLEDLKPHPNLKKLHVRGWRGDAKVPSWLSLLTNLVDIGIEGPSKFKHLPSFSRLPYLNRLKISKLIELEYMEDSDPTGGQGDSESFFPLLKLLHLEECPNMESWWRESPIDENKDRTASTMAFPCLSTLCIKNCPLTSMPLSPTVDNELILVNTSSRPLKRTIQMRNTINSVGSCTWLKSLSSSTSFVPFSKLKSFEVENIKELDLDMLDECLKNMTSLKRWGIGSCSWLKSLSELLQQMTGLTSLKIKDCKELDLEGMQWEPLKNLSHLVIDNIPQLESLPRWLQHLDQLKTLEIENCSGLKSLSPGFQYLISLEKLQIIDCTKLEFPADGTQIFEDYTSLRHVHLQNIQCQHLPGWLQHVTNLRELLLVFLPNLTSFPDELQCLTSVEQLHLIYISQLPNWHQIAHIPRIWVDCVQVQ